MKKQIVFGLVFALLIINLVHASEIISDSGVKYDSEILEMLKNSKWVPIIVDIKDITNISVSYKDSIEIQKTKDNERKRILSSITNSILSTLPEEEFKLKRVSLLGDGFSGNITKKGFDKLLNNSRVNKIFFDGELYIVSTARIKNIFAGVIKIILVISFIAIIHRLIKNRIKKNKK